MERDETYSRFAKFAWFTLAYNVMVILWGVFLRASKSGDGCGQHWLTCQGEIIPSAPELKTIIEFSHRMTTGPAFVLVLILMVWAFRRFEKGSAVRKVAVASVAFIVSEVLIGGVLVDEKRVSKPSELFATDAPIRIKGQTADSRYVGRGGLKLEAALNEFKISPVGFACLDVGSSTGGFTDCLLQQGATSVVALDVGTNQLAWKIRSDPRVEVRENTNARSLSFADLGRRFDLIVMDVSFISASKILPALTDLLAHSGKIIVLIKPQFEVGKGEVGKGGIVREPEKRERVVSEVNDFAVGLGLRVIGTIDSPITGAEGNREFLSCYSAADDELAPKLVEGEDYYFEDGLMVLTESFLGRRGYCCGNGCRHCPYPNDDQSRKSSNSL